ncbi:hypothetical protein ACFL9T_16985 [Thermodesulfobacteriota bacterium]
MIAGSQKGYTLVEIVLASMLLVFLVGVVLKYHSIRGASHDQKYYLKAVETAKQELEKLRSLYEIDSGITEFENTGVPNAPDGLFLAKVISASPYLDILTPEVFKIYYSDHGQGDSFLRPLWGGLVNPDSQNGVTHFGNRGAYESGFEAPGFDSSDTVDKRTFTYFLYDGNTETNFTQNDQNNIKIDLAGTVIDDMGSPEDPMDDLLGMIGWWVEDAGVISGVTHLKKITFALQFWYPGQKPIKGDAPEVIILKTTFVKPD